MTSVASAAEIWAALERRLIERCGLPDGHMLEVNRPYLIRWIGDRLNAVPVDVERRAAAGTPVRPPLRKHQGAPPLARRVVEHAVLLPAPHVAQDRRSAQHAPRAEHDSGVEVRRVDHDHRGDTIHDPKLAAMLDRSCSLRGYEEDETVTFDPK